MIVVNKTKMTRTYHFNGHILTIGPESESKDTLLSEEDVRSIIVTAGPEKIQFKVTNPVSDNAIFSKLNMDAKYIYKNESQEVEVEEVKSEPVKEEVKEEPQVETQIEETEEVQEVQEEESPKKKKRRRK